MPKHLNSTAKKLMASLIDYFEKERDNGGPLLPLQAVRENFNYLLSRVAQALNVSSSTVSAISNAVKNNELLKSPSKHRPYPKSVTDITHLNVDSIRNAIYEMDEKVSRYYATTSFHVAVSEDSLITLFY
ncbi:hypothetical protein RI129_011211 [Pyrocoelia pectoralis]|uniref:Uncharacterized protein n=1 Tax=Pyrocoelia pectoralis TaxID=417401 RepID=A0AAN7ZAK2_9COLE